MSAKPILVALGAALLAATHAVAAATPVQSLSIRLEDSSTDASILHMRIVLDAQTIKPGRVTLRAENRSGSLVHEVLVVRDDGGKPLALDATHTRLVESKLHRLGEIPELKPGKTGKLTLNLEPGAYLVLCNQPGHYMDGMVAKLTVAP